MVRLRLLVANIQQNPAPKKPDKLFDRPHFLGYVEALRE